MKHRWKFIDTDLSREEWLMMLRNYRTLRLHVPAFAPGQAPAVYYREIHYYGMSKNEARKHITNYWCEVSWYSYLGTK